MCLAFEKRLQTYNYKINITDNMNMIFSEIKMCGNNKSIRKNVLFNHQISIIHTMMGVNYYSLKVTSPAVIAFCGDKSLWLLVQTAESKWYVPLHCF